MFYIIGHNCSQEYDDTRMLAFVHAFEFKLAPTSSAIPQDFESLGITRLATLSATAKTPPVTTIAVDARTATAKNIRALAKADEKNYNSFSYNSCSCCCKNSLNITALAKTKVTVTTSAAAARTATEQQLQQKPKQLQ